LEHGTTLHGRQYLDAQKSRIPLSYFHPTTPAAQVMASPEFSFGSIGMIGLGAGTLAGYVGPGQSFTIFELDPANLPIAEHDFSYLAQARKRGAKINIVVGDGRLSLRRLPDHDLDLLIMDAFNSGAVPVHLLTVEAVGEYFRVLRPGGLLLVNVSHKFLHLGPLVGAVAGELRLHACGKTNKRQVHPDAELTAWVAICRDDKVYDKLVNTLSWQPMARSARTPRPWTDQYSNLISLLF
jgi:spermidine synthase